MLEAGMSPSAAPRSTTAPSYLRRLLVLSWPVVVARAAQSVIGFSDALMVSPLGEESLAAVTTGAFNTFVLIILPMGTSVILQSFAAQLRGKGELAAVRRYAWYGMVLALFAGVFALCAIPLVPLAVRHLGYAPGVERAMITYVSIRLLSVGAVVGTEALGNWYGGMGNTRVAMIAGATAMVVNVLGCYALIQPRFGLPGFGVAGSGWASVIASTAGFAVVAVTFALDRSTTPSQAEGTAADRATPRLADASSAPEAPSSGGAFGGQLRWSEFARVLRFGLPNGANWFLEFAAFAVFVNVVAGHLGTTVLAAFNVVIQINSISFMPAWGVSTAGAILVGEAIGRRAKDEVWPLVRLTGAVAIGWMLTVSSLYVVAPATLIRLFAAPGDDRLVLVGATMLTLSAVWQLFDGIGITLSESLRAAGDTTWPMVARVLLGWSFFIPVSSAVVLLRGGGVVPMMLILVAYIALLAVALAVRFASGRWREIQLVEPDVTREPPT